MNREPNDAFVGAMSRRVWTGIFLVLVGAGLFLWQGLGGPSPPLEPEASAPELPASAPGPELVAGAARLELARPEPERRDATPEERPERRRALPLFGVSGPPDWIEAGEGELSVLVLDRATREPGTGRVDLWRIGAPANESWSDGDQRQFVEKLEEGRARFSNLAPGTYRIHLQGARVDSPATPPFEVTEDPLGLTVTADFPRSFPGFIDVRRLDGSVVPKIDLDVQPAGGSLDGLRPEWLRPRYPLDPKHSGIGGGAAGSSSRRRWRGIERGPQGFPIGKLSEPARGKPARWRVRVRAEGRTAEGIVLGSEAVDQVVTVVLADPREIATSLLDETGQPIPDATEHLSIEGGVVVSNLPSPWLEATYKIVLDHPEREPKKLTWRPADGPVPTTIVRPRE